MRTPKHTGQLILQTFFFITVTILISSCANKNQENNTTQTKKQKKFIPPVNVLIKNPILVNSDTCPLPRSIIIPTKHNYQTITQDGGPLLKLAPPEIKVANFLSLMQTYTTDNGLALDAISFGYKTSICDHFGNLWFCTDGGGVSRFDGKSFTNFTTAQGLTNNNVRSILEDRTGNLWFGTYGGGVTRYDGKSFTSYTTEQGLANNIVWSIAEDKTGNLWFGTDGGGVSCYDGNYEALSNTNKKNLNKIFTNYTTDQGLANNKVLSIAEDKIGNLWFGTFGGGVSRYDGNRVEAIERGDKIAQQTQLDLKKINGKFVKSFTNYTASQGLANNHVRSILEDKAGNLWFSTDGGGVSRYTPLAKLGVGSELFTNFNIEQGLVNKHVYYSTEDKNGNIWFGTFGGGVSRYDGKSFTNFTTEQGLVSNNVRGITEDKTGNLWFGTYGGGVSRYDGKSFINFTVAQGLTNNIVRSILEDKMGNLWFGTNGNGISRYDGKSFTNFTRQQGLMGNSIKSILEDKTGNIWFGATNGLFCYNGNRVEAIEKGDKTTQRTQQDLKKTNGKLVKSFTNFTTAQGLPHNTVLSIAEDKKGNLWFGTLEGGISRYNPMAELKKGSVSFTNYSKAQGLASNTVRSIKEDKTGKLWFATDGGLSCYDPSAEVRTGSESFTNYTTDHGLANNMVFSISEDKTGNLWFGTNGGLSRYDASAKLRTGFESFTNYTTNDGLPDNVITQVIVASLKTSQREGEWKKEDCLVIGTNLGIAILTGWKDKNGKLIPFEHKMDTTNDYIKNYSPVFEIYNSSNGYPVKDVNTGQNCLFVDSKGIIWVGTGSDKTALVRFDYAALNKNLNPPTVIIQRVKINESIISWYNLDVNENDSVTKAQQEVMAFGKSLDQEVRGSIQKRFNDIKFESISKFYPIPKNLVLPYDHNSVTFDFTAIETGKNFLVRYQYILEGYEKDWSPITEKTSATFGNMYEGTYTFKLKAKSPFGVWSQPIEYKFKVLPPFWRTWWMYALYGILVIALIIFIVLWNGRRLIAKAKELDEEIKRATVTILEQKKVVEEKHKEITDSINYAERIQRSFLASTELLNENLNDYFVFFQPKDVVSGDFYWASKLRNGSFVLVTGDSTGHGVPGAIMSILNISSLEKAIEQGFSEPSEILCQTRKTIIERLKKDGSAEGGKDGMDASLICFDLINKKFIYAAANNPIWVVRGNDLIELKPDKMPVGKNDKDQIEFTQTEFSLQTGDMVYTITDGFSDQFGGSKGKKFMSKQLKQFLLSISFLPVQEQKLKLNYVFDNWKGSIEQVDDVCLIGIRV